jgi:hypothetical protein
LSAPPRARPATCFIASNSPTGATDRADLANLICRAPRAPVSYRRIAAPGPAPRGGLSRSPIRKTKD